MTILDYINLHKLPAALIAVAIIVFIGILKVAKVFNKLTNKDLKKGIYFGLSVVLSFACAAIYYAICKFNWQWYWLYSLCQATATTMLYALYEYLGPRKLVQLLFTWLASLFKKSNTLSLAFLKELGLSDETINKIGEAIKTELDRIANEKAAAENALPEVNETIPEEDPTEITVKTE